MAGETIQPRGDSERAVSPGEADTHHEPPPHNQPYRPALDGIRALAIVPVLLFHLKERWFPGGFVGVDVFFVISGFLITNGLLRDLQRGDFSISRFYQRRIARLFPSMVLLLAACSVLAVLLYDRAIAGLLAPSLMASILSVNNVMSAYESNYFSAASDAHPLLHFWSLSVEEQFYLLFPVLLLLVWRWRRQWLVPGLLVAAVVSLLLCIRITPANQTWAFYMLPTRAWELLAGSLLAALPPRALQWVMPRRAAAATAGLVLLLGSFLAVRPAHFPGAIATWPVLATVLLIAGVSGGTNWVNAFLSRRPLVETGRLSYVLYLWHLPVFCLVDYQLFLTAEWKRTVLKLALTAVLGLGTAFLVENPARWWLNRRENRVTAFALAGTAVVLLVLCGGALRLRGWPEPRLYMFARGGFLLNGSGRHGVIALAGDSQACATATTLREIAVEQAMQLRLMCISGTVPVMGGEGEAWNRTLLAVQRTRPDVLVYEIAWPERDDFPEMLANSVAALAPYAHRVVLVTQYPVLEPGMPRETLRRGMPLPFYETEGHRLPRERANDTVRRFGAEHGIAVVDTDPGFTRRDGSVHLLDEKGRPLYFDWMHASSVGTATYRDALSRAITAGRACCAAPR